MKRLPKLLNNHVLLPLFALLLCLLPSAQADGTHTYLALGDSVAFGQTNVIPVSYGDQGYVSLVANALAGQSGGIRPNVINLGVSGETSGSFFTGFPPPGWTSRTASANLNYPTENTSQSSLLNSKVASEAAIGHSIDLVTFAIGPNDFFALAQTPTFQLATPAQQQLLAAQTFTTLQSNVILTLTQIRTALPNTHLLLLDNYNPFGAFGPNDPNNQLIAGVLTNYRSLMTSLAPVYNAQFVPFGDAFVGHELELTYIGQGNVHPNAAGYQVIANRVIAAAVPEPAQTAAWGIELLGLAGLVLTAKKRKAASAV